MQITGIYNALFPFFCFLIALSIFRTIVYRQGKKYRKNVDDYVKQEWDANFARRKPIPDDFFYHPDKNALPIKDYSTSEESVVVNRLKKAQETALRKRELQMFRIYPPMSNIEFKKAYGLANLQAFIQYEENYTEYVHALNRWAEELIKNNFPKDAEQVLLAAVTMESNISKTYTLLADIYAANNDFTKLNDLIQRINTIEIITDDPGLHQKIITYIESIRGFN